MWKATRTFHNWPWVTVQHSSLSSSGWHLGRSWRSMEPSSQSRSVYRFYISREIVCLNSFLVDDFNHWLITLSYRLIWDLRRTGKTSIEHILLSHYRAITDINWHTTECDIVISTGIDSWLWAWDLRTPRKPIFGQLHVDFVSISN